MHDLQLAFASEDGEAAWAQDLHALFGAGALDEAEALLAEALVALDTELAWECLELPREAVVLTGWDELGEAIALHEGEPVTGVTIAIANHPDDAFDKGRLHHPRIALGIYTDDAYPFSGAAHWQLLDQSHAHQPAWAGREEDIEVHMDIEGLDALNTRLIHHNQRHFFRDGAPGAAPLRYVEYVLLCWWRALRWHQAVATECAIRGLPGAVPVVAGMEDMRPEAVAIHDSGQRHAAAPLGSCGDLRTAPAHRMAPAISRGFVARQAVAEDAPVLSGTDIRRRAVDEGTVMDRPPRAGVWARVFGRR